MASTDFTVADVLAWARTKPADEVYDYTDPSNCAICQFITETGRGQSPQIALNEWDEEGQSTVYFDARIAVAANSPADESFGGLVRRLEALCPEAPVTKSDWLAIDAYLSDIEMEAA